MPRTLRVSVKATATTSTKKYTKRNKAYWAKFEKPKKANGNKLQYKGALHDLKGHNVLNIHMVNGDVDKFAKCFSKAKGGSALPVHIIDVQRLMMDMFLRA
jgi:hypothetical protein